MSASTSLPRHLERSLVLLLDGPVIRRGDTWRQEQPDPDATPKLVIARKQTITTLYALRLVVPLTPYRSLPRMGLSAAGRELASGVTLRTAAHMRAFTMAHQDEAARALREGRAEETGGPS